MSQRFPELVLGGVLVAPFVTFALVALGILVLLRPVLLMVDLDEMFANSPVVVVSIYAIILAILIVVT